VTRRARLYGLFLAYLRALVGGLLLGSSGLRLALSAPGDSIYYALVCVLGFCVGALIAWDGVLGIRHYRP
jgi:hypothetical protein